MFENEDSGAVEMLHDKGYKVICYIDVGSWGNWRDDNPAKSKTGTKLATILEARFDRAVNVGSYANVRITTLK